MKTATIHIFLFIFGVLMVKTLASPISKADFLDELLGTLETVLEEGKNQISNSISSRKIDIVHFHYND